MRNDGDDRPQNAAAWVRISNDAAGDAHGVKDQETYLREFGRKLGWKIKHVIKENDVSASRRTRKVPDGNGGYIMRTDRPEFLRLLRMIRAGEIDGLVVREVDRAVRDMRDLEDLIDAVESRHPRLPVESIKGNLRLSTGSEIMAARLYASIAIGEARKTSERISDTKRLRAAEGRYRGGPRPYGFESDGVTIVAHEAAEIRRAADMLLDGQTLSEIGRDMLERGVHGPAKTNRRSKGRGREGQSESMRVMTVRQILIRARNAGLVEHHGEIVGKAEWPAIIPEEKWRAVCAILGDPARRTSPGPAVKHLGSNLYYCGLCLEEEEIDSLMKCMWGSDPDAAAYMCKRKLHLTSKKKNVDAVVVGEITRKLADPTAVSLLRKHEYENPDRAMLGRAAADIRRKLVELDESYKSGRISITRYESVAADLERKLAGMDSALSANDDLDPLARIAGNPDAARIWDTLLVERQRAILRELCEVTIYRQARRQNQHVPFDTDSVQIDWLR